MHAEFSKQNRAGLLKLHRGSGIVVGNPVLQYRRMTGGTNSLGRVEIFERDGNAVQRPAVGSGSQLLFRLPGLFEGEVAGEGDEAVQLAVQGIDTIETGIGEFDGGKLFAPQPGGSFGDGQIAEFALLHGLATSRRLWRL